MIISLQLPMLEQLKVQVDMKRDDLLDPIVSGNKWRKLKYLLQDATMKNKQILISMGGNYSNHLHALAYAGKKYGFKTIGKVRANEQQSLTPTLQDCQEWGMKLEFVNREEYKTMRRILSYDAFEHTIENSYWITEGGFSDFAIQGVKDIALEVEDDYDYVFCGVGSGATLIGLALAFPESTIIGVAAFKGAEYLDKQLIKQFPEVSNWQLLTNFHFGGFAKITSELEMLSEQFKKANGFELDKVYNLKVLSVIMSYVYQGKIKSGQKILMINTGGLQGNRN